MSAHGEIEYLLMVSASRVSANGEIVECLLMVR